MEGELRMKMQYDSRMLSQGEKPYINVLPNHPYEAYKRMDHETLSQIRKTERVPLPQVRELILMYILREQQAPPLEESELLREKLKQTNMQEYDRQLNRVSEKWMMEEQRIQQLSTVFQEYRGYREQLISRAVMKSKHNVHEEAEKFKSEVQAIDQEKNRRINDFLSKANSLRHSNNGYRNSQDGGELPPQEQEEIRSIERQANVQTVQHIRSQNELNIKYEAEEQERLFGLRYLDCFLREFQKALVFIVGARHVANISDEHAVANENYYKTFSDKLKHYKGKTKQLKEHLLDHIFDWRMDLKRDRAHDSKMVEYSERSQQFGKEIESELYYFIPNILCNLERDREELRSLTDYFTKNYENYLGSYYSIKEVQLYHSKQSHIEEIINNERMALNSHLKKNFGMMVPFKKSHEYEELASLAISRDKPYLKTLMEEKISHLEQAIAYINYDHSNLYKEACDGNPAVQGKIRRKLEDFQLMGTKYPELRAHLEQSCQRLLQIVNH